MPPSVRQPYVLSCMVGPRADFAFRPPGRYGLAVRHMKNIGAVPVDAPRTICWAEARKAPTACYCLAPVTRWDFITGQGTPEISGWFWGPSLEDCLNMGSRLKDPAVRRTIVVSTVKSYLGELATFFEQQALQLPSPLYMDTIDAGHMMRMAQSVIRYLESPDIAPDILDLQPWDSVDE